MLRQAGATPRLRDSLRRTVALVASSVAPKGQIQPQKNRPKTNVRARTINAGQTREITALPASAAAAATRGSMRRKTLTA